MSKENRTRINFAEKFQEIINRCNAGGMAAGNYFDEMLKLNNCFS
jgi:type I restriction enzyme R subunit